MLLQKQKTKLTESDVAKSTEDEIEVEVEVGDLVDETTDAIVNGVSENFNLGWGKSMNFLYTFIKLTTSGPMILARHSTSFFILISNEKVKKTLTHILKCSFRFRTALRK